MPDPQQLDRELREYLDKEPNLRREDRINYLKSMMNKHFEFLKLDHMINRRDLYEIVAGAKSNFTDRRVPVRISKIQVDQSELTTVAIVESMLAYLNRNNLLKKQVKFDYTD
jgi:hypothetical protein